MGNTDWLRVALDKQHSRGEECGYSAATWLVVEVITELYAARDNFGAELVRDKVLRRLRDERTARLAAHGSPGEGKK